MTCNHDKEERISAADMLYADGICPICLHAQLALAVNVVEAAERFKTGVERILDPSDEEYANISKELLDAIAKFKGGQDASL